MCLIAHNQTIAFTKLYKIQQNTTLVINLYIFNTNKTSVLTELSSLTWGT